MFICPWRIRETESLRNSGNYGGSSIVSTFMLFAMIQGLYIIKRNDEEEMGVAED